MEGKKFLITGCLALAGLSAGCIVEGHSHGTHNMRGGVHHDDSIDSDDLTYRCSAAIAPGVMDYWLDGDVLTLSDPYEVDDLVMTRDGYGYDVYDWWLAHVSDDGVLESRLYFVIGPDTVTVRNECTGLDGAFGVAEATSRAYVTYDTLETFDDVEDVVVF